MKKIILICLLFMFLLGFDIQAQGNLQFNQVLFIEMQGTSVSGSTPLVVSRTLVVPAGKVVKLESTSLSYLTTSQTAPSSGGSSSFGELFLNDKTITNTNSGSTTVRFPIWLKEGTYTLKLIIRSAGLTTMGFVSGIEFNVTPP